MMIRHGGLSGAAAAIHTSATDALTAGERLQLADEILILSPVLADPTRWDREAAAKVLPFLFKAFTGDRGRIIKTLETGLLHRCNSRGESTSGFAALSAAIIDALSSLGWSPFNLVALHYPHIIAVAACHPADQVVVTTKLFSLALAEQPEPLALDACTNAFAIAVFCEDPAAAAASALAVGEVIPRFGWPVVSHMLFSRAQASSAVSLQFCIRLTHVLLELSFPDFARDWLLQCLRTERMSSDDVRFKSFLSQLAVESRSWPASCHVRVCVSILPILRSTASCSPSPVSFPS